MVLWFMGRKMLQNLETLLQIVKINLLYVYIWESIYAQTYLSIEKLQISHLLSFMLMVIALCPSGGNFMDCAPLAVTADGGLNVYIKRNAICPSVHGNFKSRKWRSLVNISRDPQGVSRSIKLLMHLYTVHDHLLARGHKLSTFYMQQGKTLRQRSLSIGMHTLQQLQFYYVKRNIHHA